MEVWNNWDTLPPPICNVECKLDHQAVTQVKETLFDAISSLTRWEPLLHSEAAILSRLLYRIKRIFRHDRGFQNLSKVHQGLRRCLKLDLRSTLSDYKQCLPQRVALEVSRCYLPTRQMLKWVLLRLQAFAMLMKRLCSVSYQAAGFIYMRSLKGHGTTITIFALSVVCRLHVLCKHSLRQALAWYPSLLASLPSFKETLPYLPSHAFPSHLPSWLEDGETWQQTTVKSSRRIDKIFELIDLADDDDGGFENLAEEVQVVLAKEFGDVKIDKMEEDIGEPVARPSKKRKKTTHDGRETRKNCKKTKKFASKSRFS